VIEKNWKLRFCTSDKATVMELKDPCCLHCKKPGHKIQYAQWKKTKPFCRMSCALKWAQENTLQKKWCGICGWYTDDEYNETHHEILGL
tara:strand:- start:29278 stop:29544 length:267 start_codon:yes stop_codon:yes gene_type:complete